jgi:hypothetical protein
LVLHTSIQELIIYDFSKRFAGIDFVGQRVYGLRLDEKVIGGVSKAIAVIAK